MCGIAGFYFHDVENPPLTPYLYEGLIDELLLGIEHRGYDATGVAALSASGALHIEKADTPASNFIHWRSDLPETPRSVLLHTRFATKGSPMNLQNNHPIRYNNAVVTHNGHINNDDDIFADNTFCRNAQVDSECIPALLNKHGIDKVNLALKELDGNYALAMADLRKPNTLVLAKGWSSPLHYFKTEEGICWASEEKVLIDAINTVLNLGISYKHIDKVNFGKLLLIEDGEVEELSFPTYEKSYSSSSYYSSTPKTCDTGGKGSEDKGSVSEGWNRQAWQDDDEDESMVARFVKKFNRRKKQDKQTKKQGSALVTTADKYYDSDPLHVEFWRNEPHKLEYEIPSANIKGLVFLFKRCDKCETVYQTTLLTIIEDDSILCPKCLEDHDEAMDLIEENPAVVHEVTCEMVAEKFQTNPDFVHWLLFDSDDEDLNDPDSILVSLYLQFDEEYNKVYKELSGDSFGAAATLARLATENLDGDTQLEIEEGEFEDCGVEAFESDYLAAYDDEFNRGMPTV